MSAFWHPLQTCADGFGETAHQNFVNAALFLKGDAITKPAPHNLAGPDGNNVVRKQVQGQRDCPFGMIQWWRLYVW